jgi:hypothetical protein
MYVLSIKARSPSSFARRICSKHRDIQDFSLEFDGSMLTEVDDSELALLLRRLLELDPLEAIKMWRKEERAYDGKTGAGTG